MRNWLIDDQASAMMIPTANMSHTMGGMRRPARARQTVRARVAPAARLGLMRGNCRRRRGDEEER